MNRTIIPKFISPSLLDIHFPKCEKMELNNKVPYYFLRDEKFEIFQFEIVFLAGNCAHAQKLIASFTNSLLNSSTKYKTALEIETFLESRGAFLKPYCSYQTASITLSGLSQYFEDLVDLLYELLSETIFPEEEILIHTQNSRQQLKLHLEKSDFVADRKINEMLYGIDHPYGQFAQLDDFDKIQRTDIIHFFKNHYIHSKAILFGAGNLPSYAFDILNKYFGNVNWQPLQKNDYPFFNTQPSTQQKIHITLNPYATQTSIRLGTECINMEHADFPEMQLLNLIFGGYFGSRLMTNLREDKGYTYGIYSYLQHHFHQSALIITGEVGKDVTGKAMDEIYKELETLYTLPIANEELIEAKNYMIGNIINDNENVFGIINKYKSFILHFLDPDFFEHFIVSIKQTTTDDLQNLATKYLKNKPFYEVYI